jgi:hypothetical protein
MAELALLPLCLGLVLGLLAVVTLLPVSVTVLLSAVVFVATILLVKDRRARMPRVLNDDQKKGRPLEIKSDSADVPTPHTTAATEVLQDNK